ncbi:phosphotransferase [Deinococcus sp.]|uniref:phosphotransferase n=1 Tax=Deinococcus sp. TaxID=47478 RepID=UPI002869D737|nr:phosphotransferase [Deinococcus sp.]
MSTLPGSETALHLLYTRIGQAALHTLNTDQLPYHGDGVAEAARAAGLPGHLLRRLHFRSLGEVDGVRRSECVWHLEAGGGAALDWRPDDIWDGPQRAWIALARTPPTNVPWMHPGWHAGALAWLDAELAAQGQARTGEPVILKHAQISALWRVPTAAGSVYFKAVPDFFAREVELTPALARELEGAAPPVLAADTTRGFLLLGDAGEVVAESLDLDAVMVHVAELQQQSLTLLPALALRDRGPEYVLGWLEHLFTDACLLNGQEGGFTPEEAQKLRELRPMLEAALLRLAASSIPRTLGHGDLHGGNIVTRGGHFTLLDWSDVCRTHPFLDVNPAYFYPWQVDPPQAPLDAARDVYLRQWTAIAPLVDLRPLFADALVCGELFRALGYVDGLQSAVEDKAEWRTAHLDHLRRVLRLTAAQDWTWTP